MPVSQPQTSYWGCDQGFLHIFWRFLLGSENALTLWKSWNFLSILTNFCYFLKFFVYFLSYLFQNFGKYFSKKIFRPKICETLLALPLLGKNSINLVTLQSSIDLGTIAIAQSDYNRILFIGRKKVLNFSPKTQQINFWAQTCSP